MSRFLKEIKRTVDATMPDKDALTHANHPRRDYLMLLVRNVLVGVAVLFFVTSFFLRDLHNILRAIGYFCGAGAYLFECLLLTDCLKTKVPHEELFMVYFVIYNILLRREWLPDNPVSRDRGWSLRRPCPHRKYGGTVPAPWGRKCGFPPWEWLRLSEHPKWRWMCGCRQRD